MGGGHGTSASPLGIVPPAGSPASGTTAGTRGDAGESRAGAAARTARLPTAPAGTRPGVRVATTAKTSPNIKVELENLGLPHTTSPSELAVLRTAKGWEPWVLELTAKQRNRLILKLQLSDEETCSLKAAASRHKQRDSQRRYVGANFR